jgi:outer membrane protein assembly factor BamB
MGYRHSSVWTGDFVTVSFFHALRWMRRQADSNGWKAGSVMVAAEARQGSGDAVTPQGGRFVAWLAASLLLVIGCANAEASAPAAAAAAAFQDATGYQMNAAHTGVSADPVGPDWTLQWKTTGSGAFQTPIIADGRVFALVDSSSPYLDAFDASTGALDWSVPTGPLPTGITYDGGRLFEQSGTSAATITAFDPATGSVDWSSYIPDETNFYSAPTAANGIVYTSGDSSGGELFAYDESNGALLWKLFMNDTMNSAPAVDSTHLYVSYSCDTKAINGQDGSPVWTADGCTSPQGLTMVLADGYVFLRDRVLDASTGQEVRTFGAGPAPAVDRQYVYVEDHGALHAETVARGQIVWSTAGDGGFQTSPIEVNGIVYEGSSSGHLFGFSAITGRQVVDLDVGTPIGPSTTGVDDSYWSLAEGDGLLAIPAGDTLTVYGQGSRPPTAPTSVVASSGAAKATVSWTVPSNGGNPITDFTVTPILAGTPQTPMVVPVGAAGSTTDPTPGAPDTVTVPGLTPGDQYTFVAAADSAGGQGASSNPSAGVTPISPPASVLPPETADEATAFQITSVHSGVSPDTGAGPDWALQWSKTAPGAFGTPLITPSQILVLVQTSPPSLIAYDRTTGAQEWVIDVGANDTGIAYQAGRVFEQSDGFGNSAVLTAFDAATGTSLWSKVLTANDSYLFDSAPTAANGIVYTLGQGLNSGTLFAFDQTTGALLWTARTTGGDSSSPAVDAKDVSLAYVCDNAQYIDAQTGAVIWTHNTCDGGGGQTTVLADGYVILRNAILNAASGAAVRSLSSGTIPAVDSEYLYTETTGTLSAQSVGAGQTAWSTHGDGGLDTPPVVADGVVYEGSSTGHVLGYSAVTGQQVTDLSVGSPISPIRGNSDSGWSIAEADRHLAVPAGDTLDIYAETGSTPAAPSGVTATVGAGQATIRWRVPQSAGSPIDAFTITPFIGQAAQTPLVVRAGVPGSSTDPSPGAQDQATMTGLSDATSYSFAVAADNLGGQGATADSNQVTPGSGGVTASRSDVNFGSVRLGAATSSYRITITNQTTTAQTISNVSIGGGDTADFTVSSSDCGALASGSSCQITLQFQPGATGGRTAQAVVSVQGGPAVTIDLTGIGTEGFYVANSSGAVRAFGAAPPLGDLSGIKLSQPVSGMASTVDGGGYWLVGGDGGVFNFGDARFFGGTGGRRLWKPIVGISPTPDNGGYWLVAADGGVFTFGDARYFGGLGGKRLNAPVVGMQPTPDGNGYWLVASDGGVFSFGDAAFAGSLGGTRLAKPVVGMARTADGHGYWLVAADGGVFTFGDAGYFGSTGNKQLNSPVTAMTATPDGKGYWLAATDGGIFNFGSAPFMGSAGGQLSGTDAVAESGSFTRQVSGNPPA